MRTLYTKLWLLLILLLFTSCQNTIFLEFNLSTASTLTETRFSSLHLEFLSQDDPTINKAIDINNGTEIGLPTSFAVEFPNTLRDRPFLILVQGRSLDNPTITLASAEVFYRVGEFRVANLVLFPVTPELCNNGKDDDGNGQIDCQDEACFPENNCVIPGNGFRTPGVEQCDDGNLEPNDGCSPQMNLESRTTVTVENPNAPSLFGTSPANATRSAFFTQTIDTNGDGQAESTELVVVSTNRADVCDLVRNAGGVNAFISSLFFGGNVNGTFAVSTLRQTGPNGFSSGEVLGNTTIEAYQPFLDNIVVDLGYDVIDGNNILSDTIQGSNGRGIALLTFTTPRNLKLKINNVVQIQQFVPDVNNPTTISEPISADITAVFCQNQ